MTRADMLYVLEKSDCFVLPSNFETFGVVYIEAMAAGLPVIATKCGGPEKIVPSFAGVLIDKNDVNQLFGAMLDMVNSIDAYSANSIKEYVSKTFSPECIAQQLISIYETLI